MSPLPPDPYKALGVDRTADSSAIRTAYRKLVLKCHPDKVQDPALKAAKQDEFQRVQQAYEILSDDKKRSEYDEDFSLKRLRDEMSRSMGRTAPAPGPGPRPTSTGYREPHIHTAEPRASFKTGPPPTSPFTNYGGGVPFGQTEFAYRPKPYTETPPRSSRRASSAGKARDESKDARRRRKEDEDHHDSPRERERDREREREREREKEREREREKERRSRSDRDEKKEKSKRDMDKREKERDRSRRQEQQEKFRTKKAVYMESYDDTDSGAHTPKKKTSGSMGAVPGVAANSSSKRHAEAPRRAKMAAPELPPTETGFQDRYTAAREYIKTTRGDSAVPGLPEPTSYPHQSYMGGDYWPPSDESPRQRRSSQDDKRMRSRGGDAEFIKPPMYKSNTSPGGMMYMASSVPRVPGMMRASTNLEYHSMASPDTPAMPPVPSAPLADPGRHSRKAERRRRGDAYDAYDDGVAHMGHSPSASRSYEASPLSSRSTKTTHYRPDYHSAVASSSSRPVFDKVRETPVYGRDSVYEAKRFSDEDVKYSHVQRSSYVVPA